MYNKQITIKNVITSLAYLQYLNLLNCNSCPLITKLKQCPTNKKNEEDEQMPIAATPTASDIADYTFSDFIFVMHEDEYYDDPIMKEMINETHQKYSKLIHDKTEKQQLHEECVDFSCAHFNSCPCAARLIIALSAYQSYIESKFWIKQPVTPFVTYKIYEYEQILSDFHHVFRIHVPLHHNDDISLNIFSYFENRIIKRCNNDKCKSYNRHNRDKSKPIQNLKLYYNDSNETDDGDTSPSPSSGGENNNGDNHNQHETQCDLISKYLANEKDLELELDRIHVYFLHSVLRYANPLSPDDMIDDDEYEEMINSNLNMDEQLVLLQNEKEIALKAYSKMTRMKKGVDGQYLEMKSPSSDDDDQKYGHNGSCDNLPDRDTMEVIKIINNSQTTEELYNSMENKMGQFVWQRIQSVEGVKNLYNVQARYSNIKDEVLHGPFEIITIHDWNDTLRKSKKINNSWIGQSIRTHHEEKYGYVSEYDQITAPNSNNILKHTWDKNMAINLKEIIGIKLYTDFDKLQHELKKCFRIITNVAISDSNNTELCGCGCGEMQKNSDVDDDNIREMRKRLSSYTNWRQSLTVTIKKFSVSIGYSKFYHGVNPRMIIERHNILSRLWGPLSATTSYHVASTFATDKGMIIEMNSQYPRLNLCYAFDASQLSDYPEESERLVGFMYVRVRQIFAKAPLTIPTPINHPVVLNGSISSNCSSHSNGIGSGDDEYLHEQELKRDLDIIDTNCDQQEHDKDDVELKQDKNEDTGMDQDDDDLPVLMGSSHSGSSQYELYKYIFQLRHAHLVKLYFFVMRLFLEGIYRFVYIVCLCLCLMISNVIH